jgi:hypothetical protein
MDHARVIRPPSDPLIAALVRYVEALDRRYPDGPAELRRERLDSGRPRANMPRMAAQPNDPAA